MPAAVVWCTLHMWFALVFVTTHKTKTQTIVCGKEAAESRVVFMWSEMNHSHVAPVCTANIYIYGH